MTNQPNWSEAPEWANYWAADQDGVAAFYEKLPLIVSFTNSWTNSDYSQWGYTNGVDIDWARDHWETSVVERPKPNVVQHMPKNKQRITLFIEFDGPVTDIKQLSRNIAEMLCNRLGRSTPYDGKKFTPGNSAVNRIKVCIGTEQTDAVDFNFGTGFYVKGDHV